MKRRTASAVLASLVFAAQAAGPVAFVADLRGSATIEGDGNLAFLSELAPGTRLLLGTGSAVALTYVSTGAEFTLVGPGEFLVTRSEVRAERGALPMRRTVTVLPDPGIVARVSRTATASLRMRGISQGEGGASTALEFPVNTRITSLQPTLRWKNAGSPGDFTVRVVDPGGKEVWKGSSKPSSAQPQVMLAPATVYRWTVMTPNGILGEASFETLPAPVLAKAAKSRDAANSFSSRVLHALLLHDIGASQEARESWAALALERPDLPELAGLAR